MNEYHDLKNEVEAKFGKKVSTARDIKVLLKQLNTFSDNEISYNTLRRFFGFLPSTNPSVSTLNILSNFLGYSDYHSFNRLQDFADWETWIALERMKQKDILKKTDIEFLNQKFISSNTQYFLLEIIQHYFRARNVGALKRVFSIDWLNIDRLIQIKIGVSIGLTLRKLYNEESEFVEKLASISNFRNVVVYNFIDYAHFNFGYLNLLHRCKKIEKSKKHQLFLVLIIWYANFLNGEIIHAEDLVFNQEDFSETHPIVQGRLFAFKFTASSEKEQFKVFDEMVKYCKFINKCEFFFEIIPTLILLKRIDLIEQIFELYREDIFEINKENHLTHQGLFQIGLALVSIQKGNIKQAKKELESVRYDLTFDSYLDYTRIFYLLAEFHLLEDRGEVEKKYLKLARKLKWKAFNKSFLVNYFAV